MCTSVVYVCIHVSSFNKANKESGGGRLPLSRGFPGRGAQQRTVLFAVVAVRVRTQLCHEQR